MSNPANVTELFIDQTWRRKIAMAVHKFGLQEDVEDTVADIFLLMVARTDPEDMGRDYIERWDCRKSGSFANWVYTFVRNFCIKKWDRQRSEGGRVIGGALALVASGTDDHERPDRGTVFDDHVGAQDPNIAAAEVAVACERIASRLREEEPAHSWVEYAADGYTVHQANGKSQFHRDSVDRELVGRVVRRDIATVLESLVLHELDSADIAKLFKTSRQFVYTLVERLRADEDIIELRAATV